MHLWNDYENTTLAGQWTLGRLLRTEGRSALFATTRADGKPAVLRLTESLNDQAVLQARYRAIQAAGDRYLVRVEGFGDAELDGTPLSYAVLEPTQESLADILAQRKLSAEEAQEVATVVAGGLLALHGQGLVHGLLEPESVVAAGAEIKLRSDCARPAPSEEDAGLEGAVTRETDAWGLAGILYQSLTLNRLQDASDALALPEPFAAIVRNTTRGTWGVAEIEAELQRHGRAPAVPPPAAVNPAAAPVRAVAAAPVAVAAAKPDRAAEGEHPPVAVYEAQPLSSRGAVEKDDGFQPPEPISSARRRGIAIAVAAAVLLIALFLMFHRGGRPSAAAPGGRPVPVPAVLKPTPIAPARARVAAPVAALAPVAPTALAPEPAGPSQPAAPVSTGGLSSGTPVWRVVAYTYNRRDEAEGKAASLNRHHPNFKAEAWSPTGDRPFLVTLGGPMPRAQAMELRDLARQSGVARDVYAQNYSH